jgi:hypothetical protein
MIRTMLGPNVEFLMKNFEDSSLFTIFFNLTPFYEIKITYAQLNLASGKTCELKAYKSSYPL